jgi:hypothetical protein
VKEFELWKGEIRPYFYNKTVQNPSFTLRTFSFDIKRFLLGPTRRNGTFLLEKRLKADQKMFEDKVESIEQVCQLDD